MKKTVEQNVKKMVQLGYGLGILSMQQARKAVAAVRKEFGLSEKESVALARELVKTSAKASREVLGTVAKYADEAISRTGIASKKELQKARKVLRKRLTKRLKKSPLARFRR